MSDPDFNEVYKHESEVLEGMLRRLQYIKNDGKIVRDRLQTFGKHAAIVFKETGYKVTVKIGSSGRITWTVHFLRGVGCGLTQNPDTLYAWLDAWLRAH